MTKIKFEKNSESNIKSLIQDCKYYCSTITDKMRVIKTPTDFYYFEKMVEQLDILDKSVKKFNNYSKKVNKFISDMSDIAEYDYLLNNMNFAQNILNFDFDYEEFASITGEE